MKEGGVFESETQLRLHLDLAYAGGNAGTLHILIIRSDILLVWI